MIRSYIILFKNNQFRSLSPLISIMHFLPQEKASCSLPTTKYLKNSNRLENGSLLSWGSCLLFHWENKSNQKSPKLPPTLPPICYWSIYPAFLPVYPPVWEQPLHLPIEPIPSHPRNSAPFSCLIKFPPFLWAQSEQHISILSHFPSWRISFKKSL